MSKESTQLERHRGAKQERPLTPEQVLDEEGTLWRESRSSIAGDAVKRYITMLSHHHRTSGSPSTLLTIQLVNTLETQVLISYSQHSSNLSRLLLIVVRVLYHHYLTSVGAHSR